MAEPAHVSAADLAPGHPGSGEDDPGESKWAEILATQVAAMRAAVDELARRPDDAAALETARLNAAVGEKLAALFRHRTFSEQRLAVERKLGFDEGVAACKAARCRLEVIDGGREG